MVTTTLDYTSSTGMVEDAPLHCIVCKRPFDFAAGETARVLHHIAYYYDFAHDGDCLATALEWIFVEPGYDRPAFGLGHERVRVIRADPADGWVVVSRDPRGITSCDRPRRDATELACDSVYIPLSMVFPFLSWLAAIMAGLASNKGTGQWSYTTR